MVSILASISRRTFFRLRVVRLAACIGGRLLSWWGRQIPEMRLVSVPCVSCKIPLRLVVLSRDILSFEEVGPTAEWW